MPTGIVGRLENVSLLFSRASLVVTFLIATFAILLFLASMVLTSAGTVSSVNSLLNRFSVALAATLERSIAVSLLSLA